MGNKKNILVCPLDWGLGHATRCIPIIQRLIDNGDNVIVAASGRALALLKTEFSKLIFIDFPGYNITYSGRNSMIWKMFVSIPKILAGIAREHKILKKIIHENNIEIVISDNRYGLWNHQVKTIFITHQVMVKCPKKLKLLEYPLYLISVYFMNKYFECWIPDFSGEVNLSDKLSHNLNLPSNAHFIGPLSRFNKVNKNDSENFIYDLLIILSGPEPQRTIFEEILINQLKETILKTAMVRGITEDDKEYKIADHIKVFSHLDTEKLKEYFSCSELVICRSGYSSIMDLVALNKNAILVPTPGQTEQEYLAGYFRQKNIFYSVPQKDFDMIVAIEKSKKIRMKDYVYDDNILEERINSL